MVSSFRFQVSGFKFQVSSFKFSFADVALAWHSKQASSALALRNVQFSIYFSLIAISSSTTFLTPVPAFSFMMVMSRDIGTALGSTSQQRLLRGT